MFNCPLKRILNGNSSDLRGAYRDQQNQVLINSNFSIFFNQNLETLDLSTNLLSSEVLQPGVFDNLENLKDLMLSENKLTRIETGLFAGKLC